MRVQLKIIITLLLSALLLTSCGYNGSNGGVGGNTDHPVLHVKTNVNNPDEDLFEYDTVKFEYPDFFNVEELVSQKLVIIEGWTDSGKFQEVPPNANIMINPHNEQELLIIALELNINSTGWYSTNEYYTYRISFNYEAIDKNYWNFSYIFNIRDSRVD